MLAIVLTIAWPLMPTAGAIQTQDAPALKAAFVYNFAKFTEWPVDVLPAGAPLVFCSLDDPEVGHALEQAASGQTIADHPVVVWRGRVEKPIGGCHVLYLGRTDGELTAVHLDAVKGLPVLTVGATPDFTKMGGIIRLFVENGRMRFAVNLETAQRANLRLSSAMLKLARIVHEGTE